MDGDCERIGPEVPTVCFATTPAGELVPPWIIFQSEAKDPERAPLPMQLSQGQPKGRGKFGTGYSYDHEWSAHITANKSAGMDDVTFKAYIIEVISRVYPDLANEEGKRVLLICDGGPGRYNKETIDWCRENGVDVFPPV